MKMRNVTDHTIQVPASLAAGWTGPSDTPWPIPAGAVVEVSDGYATRRRSVHSAGSNAQVQPSIAEMLSNGALQPFGKKATETYRRFSDELPETVAAMAKHRTSDEAPGVAATRDAAAERMRREALAVGMAELAARGRLADEDKPQVLPPIMRPEDLPPE